MDPIRPIKSLVRFVRHYRGPNPLKVIITGPPRSGTSLLTGMVAKMGFNLGPTEWLKPPDQFNPQGYNECVPLMQTELKILKRFGGNRSSIPAFPQNWVTLVPDHAKLIRRIVKSGGIQIYKGNMLMVLAELYHQLFPNTKWLFIKREPDPTFASEQRFIGPDITIDRRQWNELRLQRNDIWQQSTPAKTCLSIEYELLVSQPRDILHRIACHLDLNLTEESISKCLDILHRT